MYTSREIPGYVTPAYVAFGKVGNPCAAKNDLPSLEATNSTNYPNRFSKPRLCNNPCV